MKYFKVNAKNHYELGFCIGKKTKEGVKSVIGSTKYVHVSSGLLQRKYLKYLKLVSEKFPQYVEEIRGISDGANADFEKVMKLNMIILTKYYKKKIVQEESCDSCTTLVVKKRNGFVFGHNEDGPLNQGAYLINAKLPSGRKVLSLGYFGMLLGLAVNLNDSGLYFSCNSLKGKGDSFGMPKNFLTRNLIESINFDEFMSKLKSVNRAQALNFMVFFEKQVFNIECSVKEYLLENVKSNFFHANNFLFSKMKKFERRTSKKEGTFLRSKFVSERIESVKNENDIFEILSSHENRPSCVCSHGKEFGDFNLTLASVLYFSGDDFLKISFGCPCKGVFKKYSLN